MANSAPAGARPATPDGAAAPEAVSLTAEELERLSSDSEGGPAQRVGGWMGWLTGAACFGLAAYSLYWTQFAVNTTFYRSSFLSLTLALIFLLYPLVRGGVDAKPRRVTIEELVVALLGVGWMAFVISEGRIFQRSPFSGGLAVLIGLSFMAYPFITASRWLNQKQIFDWFLVIIAIWCTVHLSVYAEEIKTRATRPSPDDIVLGAALIALILETTRRTVGWILPAVTVLFLVYCYFGPSMPEPFDHRGFSLNRIIGQNYLTLEGIFSTPMDVAATFIILFTLYGAVLDRGGAGRFFIDWAFALFGKKPSPAAPGRAVVASGFLLGTVSGSGVATTVTVASLAWPMLKRSGYPAHVGGGLLSAAGIGATLSPPTLGAAAFIIAEYLDVSYLMVLIYATIPTILYYLSCWLMTEADTRRLDIKPVKTSDASLWELTKSQGYHFLSLGAIAVFLALGFSSFMAVFWSIAIAFTLSMVREDSRLVTIRAYLVGLGFGIVTWVFGQTSVPLSLGLHELFDGRSSVSACWAMAAATAFSGFQALQARRGGAPVGPDATRMIEAMADGARSTLGIIATCACAGIIVCVVNLTGLGLTLSGIIVEFGGGSRLMVIFLAAIAMWILGLAVPVTASYIIAAVMLVPALVKVGIPEPAAHMFMFYYAVLADVSPPTALAPFAASAICGGKPFRTMMQAWKYTLPAFLVPVMFCLTPEGMYLLMLTPDGKLPETFGHWMGVLAVLVASSFAIVGLVIGATAHILKPVTHVERILAAAGGFLLLTASPTYALTGGAALGAALLMHWLRVRGQTGKPAGAG
ncbi:MAG: TRAP transporter fused permease subunit [Bosea sp.]|jgi:TRAP transporter 4TM/12TM fusion protein|nr:TRAP transporter fused permease subunit [Bosea sp. (in: a-proteobacteria)]